MDNERFNVNIESLEKISNEFDTLNDDVINNLLYIKKEYEYKLDEILNTKTSQDYKIKMIDYLDKIIAEIDNNGLYFVDKLNEIISLYTNLNNEITNSVNSVKID